MVLRRGIAVLIPGIVCLLLNSCCYLAKQSSYILRYNNRSKNITELLRDSLASVQERQLFDNVKSVRQFAFDSLGLKRNGNFTKYIRIDNDHIVDVVSAAEKVSFKQYSWWYPIAGSFPYKGFFEKKDAVREAEKLKKKGLDVTIGRADAFSLLGFLKDPVYSYMKDYSIFDLAQIIIHEQTHATLYLRNNVEFNEELAVFTGTEGALSYVKLHFGENSENYKNALRETHDEESFF